MRSISERRKLVDTDRQATKMISITRQCKLLGVNRSTIYYQSKGESDLNLTLMRLMDEHYMEHPYKGAPRMLTYLKKDCGYEINPKRVDRLFYSVMGLRAIFPGPHTSKRNKEHKVYPYLLRDLKVTHPNHVWQTDITYIPMANGYMYLTAIIDVYSRYVLHWTLSNSMEAEWCAECYQEAVRKHGKPAIVNTDQGSQYTSKAFTEAVLEEGKSGVKLSMDGKGRATDNAFIEALWKMVKYEDVYLYCYDSTMDLYQGLSRYFKKYNTNRRHSSIGDNYPIDKYLEVSGNQGQESYQQKKCGN